MLRELYLLPFEMLVKDRGHALTIDSGWRGGSPNTRGCHGDLRVAKAEHEFIGDASVAVQVLAWPSPRREVW